MSGPGSRTLLELKARQVYPRRYFQRSEYLKFEHYLISTFCRRLFSARVRCGSRTVLRVRPTQRQLIPRFRTKSLQRESRQFRARTGNTKPIPKMRTTRRQVGLQWRRCMATSRRAVRNDGSQDLGSCVPSFRSHLLSCCAFGPGRPASRKAAARSSCALRTPHAMVGGSTESRLNGRIGVFSPHHLCCPFARKGESNEIDGKRRSCVGGNCLVGGRALTLQPSIRAIRSYQCMQTGQ
jgi:hypothetical protein